MTSDKLISEIYLKIILIDIPKVSIGSAPLLMASIYAVLHYSNNNMLLYGLILQVFFVFVP